MKYHILYGDSAFGSIKNLIHKENIQNEKTIGFADSLSYGPVKNIFSKEGLESRYKWLEYQNGKSYLPAEPKDIMKDYFFRRYNEFYTEIENIKESDEVFLYVQNSSRDILFLSYFLNIFPYNNIKVQFFYGKDIGTFSPNEFGKILGKGKYLTEIRRDFFKSLLPNIPENNFLRIWKNGNIKLIPLDFFDSQIKGKFITSKWQSIYSVAGNILGSWSSKNFFDLADDFIFDRMSSMVKKGNIQMKTKEIKIKLPKELIEEYGKEKSEIKRIIHYIKK